MPVRHVLDLLRRLWGGLRSASGDDAYERYLAHWRAEHAWEGGTPLCRKDFFKMQQEHKWEKLQRCC